MTIIGRERYACFARKEQGTCTYATSIKVQDFEQRVFNGLQSILLGREGIITGSLRRFTQRLGDVKQTQQQISRLCKESS